MSHFHQADSLEDALREEERLASAMRRRRRRRWMLPLLVILLVLCILFVLLYLTSDRPAPQQETEPTEAAAESITILAAGDVSLSQPMYVRARSGDSYDFTPYFRPLLRAVSSADLAVVNVEGNFCGAPYKVTNSNYPESLLRALAETGFDIVQTANSYSIENGLSGLVSTKQAIEAQGMDALGTFVSPEDREQSGGVLIREVKGFRIAWIGLTKGTNGLRLPEGAAYSVNLLFSDYDTNYTRIDREGILSLLSAAKAEKPDLILCMLHWGSEYSTDISQQQKDIAKLLLENGADAIIGSHSHRVGRIEWNGMPSLELPEQTGLVAYSLGDLLSTSDRDDAHFGCMLQLTVTRDETGAAQISEVRYLPTYSATPSAEDEITQFAVYDVLDAMALYESNYYDRISPALYEKFTLAVETLRTQTDFPPTESPENR